MKLTRILTIVLLEASLGFGSPVGLQESELTARQIDIPPNKPSDCIFSYAPGVIIIPTITPIPVADPIGFCSQLVRPTVSVIRTSTYTMTSTITKPTTVSTTRTSTSVYTTSITIISSVTVTLTRTSTSIRPTTSQPTTTSKPSTSSTSTTSIAPPTSTDGTLCPTPVADQTCGLSGWGYATNNIYSAQPVEPLACHQLCLKNPDCKSFQIVRNSTETQQCNLYNVPAGGSNTIPGESSPYVFYDRNCPNYSPDTCKFKRQEKAAVDIPIPWYFIGIAQEILTQICQCIVTKTPPATTVTQTVSKGVTVTSEILKPSTQTFVVTTSIGATSTGFVTRTTTAYATQTVTIGSQAFV